MGAGYLTQVSSLQGKHFTNQAVFPALGLLLIDCCSHLSGSVMNYWLRISSKQGVHDKYSGCLSGNEFNFLDSTKKARAPKIQVPTTFVSLPCCLLPSLLASQVRPSENPKSPTCSSSILHSHHMGFWQDFWPSTDIWGQVGFVVVRLSDCVHCRISVGPTSTHHSVSLDIAVTEDCPQFRTTPSSISSLKIYK